MKKARLGEFMKNIQSMGRGMRPGEITVVHSSPASKTSPVILDFKSPSYNDIFGMKSVWLEFKNYDTGEMYWHHYVGWPNTRTVQNAHRIATTSDDKKLIWWKNRYKPLGELTDEEVRAMTFIILKAETQTR